MMETKKRILQTALVSVASLYLFCCSNAKNLPSASTVAAGAGCPTGIGGMDASCCDSTGTVITPPASTACGLIVPGGPGVTNPISGGATAGTSVGQTTGQAASMVGGQNGVGQFAGQSAATAAQSPVSTGLNGASLPLANSGLGVTNSGNASGTGGTSGTGDTSGSVATAPSALGSPNPTASNTGDANGNGSGDQYASGAGGGGLLPNGARSTGFQFGNGLGADGGAGGASAEVGFGAQRNPASMAGEDPSDYFTRIGLSDSLFKKVEKRYRSTSANWETASLAALQIKAPK